MCLRLQSPQNGAKEEEHSVSLPSIPWQTAVYQQNLRMSMHFASGGEDSKAGSVNPPAAREPGGSCVRIVVADDQRLFRESLAGILNAVPTFEVVAVAADGIEAVDAARRLEPDVVLLDVKMPRLNGIGAARQIRAACPQTRVILLTTIPADGYAREGLAAGAHSYLLKDTSIEELIAAINALCTDRRVTELTGGRRMLQVAEHQRADTRQSREKLTAREMQTLVMVGRGMVAKEIARALGISEKTVRNHISNIYRKLGIYDRSQMVIYAMKNGLVDLQDV
jgi:DNA-binding NarL/FixJ family response regulator